MLPLTLLDNRLVVPGRVAFTPGYDGTARWSQRIFLHLDSLRRRRRRAHNGFVLF